MDDIEKLVGSIVLKKKKTKGCLFWEAELYYHTITEEFQLKRKWYTEGKTGSQHKGNLDTEWGLRYDSLFRWKIIQKVKLLGYNEIVSYMPFQNNPSIESLKTNLV